MKVDINRLHRIIMEPQLQLQQSVGTTTMEAYSVAAQVALWLEDIEAVGNHIYWLVPNYRWAHNCRNALVRALEDYGIPLVTVHEHRITLPLGIVVYFVKPVSDVWLGLNEDKTCLAGMLEVHKWPFGDYPDWIYECTVPLVHVPPDPNWRL